MYLSFSFLFTTVTNFSATPASNVCLFVFETKLYDCLSKVPIDERARKSMLISSKMEVWEVLKIIQ